MFVNRRSELSTLDSYLEMILSGQKVNVSLFGHRRTGKTELLRRFREEYRGQAIIPFLSLERSVPDISNFSLHFISEIVRSIAEDDLIAMEWTEILMASQKIGASSQKAIASLINILEKERKEIDVIGELLFRIPAIVSGDTKRPMIYIIDEFQEIKKIDDRILHIMRANTEKEPSVNYWVSGSVFSAFNEIFEGRSPFFGQFRRMDLSRFDRSSTYELVDGLLPFPVTDEFRNIIFRTTGGHPFYITAICSRLHLMVNMLDRMDLDVLSSAILMEVFDKTGAINAHFEYLLDVSLSRFRNTRIHESILDHLSGKGDNLSGISAMLGKPSGEVSNYMKGLLKTDIVKKEDDRYSLVDPLMANWLKSRYGQDGSIFDVKVRQRVFDDVVESYSALATELGRSKEFELREHLSKKYDITLKPYSTPDGQIEFDLVGERNGVHIFEIKWRNRPVDIKTIQKLQDRVERSEFPLGTSRLYIISKGGFNEKALEYASRNGIVCLSGSLEEIGCCPGP